MLVGTTLWRLLIVALALIGVSAAHFDLSALSQLGSLAVAIAYAALAVYPLLVGGRRHEPRSPWLRGAMAVTMILVSGTFLTVMQGSLDETYSLFEHLLTPLVVVVDYVAIGRNQVRARWWYPITWLALPVAYLVDYLVSGYTFYDFLQPDSSGFAGVVIGFCLGLIALGYLLLGVGRVKTLSPAAPAQAGPASPRP